MEKLLVVAFAFIGLFGANSAHSSSTFEEAGRKMVSAIVNGNVFDVKMLLRQSTIIPDGYMEGGRPVSYLNVAVTSVNPNLEVVKALLDAGATTSMYKRSQEDIDKCSFVLVNALTVLGVPKKEQLYARLDVVKLLLDRGIDEEAFTCRAKLIGGGAYLRLPSAILENDRVESLPQSKYTLDLIGIFKSHGLSFATENPLPRGMHGRGFVHLFGLSDRVITSMIESGAKFDVPDENGMTAIHWFALGMIQGKNAIAGNNRYKVHVLKLIKSQVKLDPKVFTETTRFDLTAADLSYFVASQDMKWSINVPAFHEEGHDELVRELGGDPSRPNTKLPKYAACLSRNLIAPGNHHYVNSNCDITL
ncbi:hypothetical protein [Burkholderia sp. MSMB1826]|uniref:hypothetical protein n=1 Tax=Burkholderia sp. MSMB1826 TaxID=1637875 RepID=UPI000AA879FB|nr:hypothetical protein [Burkholderia sp. MSMB1826]